MLRIDIWRLAWRDAKKLRIELVDAIHEAAAPGNGFSENSRFRIIKALDVPPIRWNVSDSLAAFAQEFPERFRMIDSAGESATDSDDSNTLLRHLRSE